VAHLSVERNDNKGDPPFRVFAKGWVFQLPILTISTRRNQAEAAPAQEI